MNDKKNTLTIGIIQQSPDLGGAETYMLSLVENFLKKNTHIILASNKGKFLERAKKLPIKTFEIPFILDIIGNYKGLIKSILLFPYAIGFYTKLLKIYKENHVDVILMSGFSEKLLVTFLSVFIRIPVVWIEYGGLHVVFRRNFYLPKILYKMLQTIPKKIIVPSQNTYKSLQEETNVAKETLLLKPLGIPINEKKKISKKVIEPAWESKFIIGNVSRLTTEKGQDYLIKAMPYVIKKISQAHLLIIGSGWADTYYKKLAEELDVSENISFIGFAQDLLDYYEVMDVFVFPTVWNLEGFGLVTVEAMARHLPIIASNFGPVPEIVDDGKTGILVPPKDEKAIADAIIALYKNPLKRKQFGEAGYQKAKKLFSLSLYYSSC